MKDTVAIEALLDRLVVGDKLAPGTRLPPLADLATRLEYEPQKIATALAAAVAKAKFVGTPDGGFEVALPSVTAASPRFSFSTTAAQHHERLVTALLEQPATRLPFDDEHPLHTTECRAQEALGLAPDQPFHVIARVRHWNGKPKVFHRVYLDPARFAPGFIEGYDFETQSVLDMYRSAGYRLLSRDTVLHSRFTSRYEDNLLLHLKRDVHLQPVLHAEQSFFATHAASGEGSEDRFVLEYMQATYFDHWQYSIHNRAPEG